MQQRVSFAGESSLNGHYYLLSPFGYLPLPCCLRTLTPLFLVHLSRWVGSHRANDKDVNRRYEKNQFIENSDLIPCKVATRAKSLVLFLGYAGFLLISPREEMQQSPPARTRACLSMLLLRRWPCRPLLPTTPPCLASILPSLHEYHRHCFCRFINPVGRHVVFSSR